MKYLTAIVLIILCVSCESIKPEDNNVVEPNYEQFSELERDSIAENFNRWANYFLQPSFAYRIYKDSANRAQPKKLGYLQTLSYSYKKRGEHIKAMAVLNEAVDKDVMNKSIDILQYRAWSLLYYYKDYLGALKDINQIEEMSKDNYSQCWGEPCSFQKSQALYKLNRYDESILEMKRLIVVEMDRYNEVSNSMYYLYIGRCYQEMGMYEDAIISYQTALSKYTEFCEAQYYLGECYELIGNLKEAKAAFESAIELQNFKMNEPYIERFDEVFVYQIKNKLAKYKK